MNHDKSMCSEYHLVYSYETESGSPNKEKSEYAIYQAIEESRQMTIAVADDVVHFAVRTALGLDCCTSFFKS